MSAEKQRPMSLTVRTVHPEFKTIRFVNWIWRYPWAFLSSITVLAAICGIIVLTGGVKTDTVGTFRPVGRQFTDQLDLSRQVAKPIYGQDQVVDQRTVQGGTGELFFVSQAGRTSGTNVLTPEVLKVVKQATDVLKTNYADHCLLVSGSCTPIESITEIADFDFDGDGNTTQDKINQAVDQIVQRGDKSELRLLGVSYDSTTRTSVAIAIRAKYGLPIAGFKNPDERETTCATPNALGLCGPKKDDQGRTQISALKSNILNEYYSDVMKLRSDSSEIVNVVPAGDIFLGKGLENALLRDAIFLAAAFVAVFFLIALFTKSFLIATISQIQIVLSFCFAVFMYLIVYGNTVLIYLQFLSLFVVLAVGADGVFIFVDGWKRAAKEYPVLYYYPERRLAWTFRHAAHAILVTSLTTAVAFFAIASSSIPSMRAIGIFSGTIICIEYILGIICTPAVIAIWHRCGADVLCCCCFRCCPCGEAMPQDHPMKIAKDAIPLELPSKSERVAPVEEVQWGKIERVYDRHITKYINKWRFIWIGLSIVAFAIGIGFATQLTPTQDSEEFVDPQHWVAQSDDLLINEFSQTGANTISIVWGLDRLDKTGIDLNDTENPGDVIYDDNFNANSTAVQQHVLDACNEAKDEKWTDIVARENENNGVICFMSQLQDWCADTSFACGTFPYGDRIQLLLVTFLADSQSTYGGGQANADKNQLTSVGYDPRSQSIGWWSIKVQSRLPRRAGAASAAKVVDRWEELEAAINAKKPSDGTDAFQIAFSWVAVELSEDLVAGVILGIVISVCLGLVIMLVMTGNLVIGVFASMTIATNVTILMGVVEMAGWDLGVFESISLQVLVGLSVDYVVHMSVAYMGARERHGMNNKQLRASRANQALIALGVSVVAGASTTIGSMVLMVPADILLFRRFGIIVLTSSFTSFILCHTFFMAFMYIVGPVKDQWDIRIWMQQLFKKVGWKKVQSTGDLENR